MEGELSDVLTDLLTEIQITWFNMTGGSLACLIDDRQVLEFSKRLRFPAKVQSAIEQGNTLTEYKYRGRKWWIIQSLKQDAPRIRFVAWTKVDETEFYATLLQTWLETVSFGIRENNLGKTLTDALVGAWDRLSFFYEFTHIVSRATDLPELMKEIIDLLQKVIFVEDVFIVLREGGNLQILTATRRNLPHANQLLTLIENAEGPTSLRELKESLVHAGSPLAESGDLLVTPITLDEHTNGMVGFIDTHPGRFSANDIQLLASAANLVCSTIESIRSRKIREEQQRLERELEVAARIQASLLPAEMPEISGIEIATYLKPARHIGGDIYASSRTLVGDPVIILADVAGKGMPAAILASIVHGTFRGHAPFCETPADLMCKIGGHIYQELERADTFVTAIVLRYKRQEAKFEYASAGHVDALLWRYAYQEDEFLPATGIPLGIDPEYSYQNKTVDFFPGDLLLIYSDGVTEAENPQGKVLGLQGLSDIIYATNPAWAADQIKTIRLALGIHRQGMPVRDDVALIMFRCLHEDDAKCSVVPFVIDSNFTAVRSVVDLIRSLEKPAMDKHGILNSQLLDDFALATSEILTNQIRHAFGGSKGRIQGRVVIESNRLVADLYDHGTAIPVPLPVRRFDALEPQERGYGLMLAEGLLDTCEYHRIDGVRNHWRLSKKFYGVDQNEN